LTHLLICEKNTPIAYAKNEGGCVEKEDLCCLFGRKLRRNVIYPDKQVSLSSPEIK